MTKNQATYLQEKGNHAFRKGDYVNALRHFVDSANQDPENQKIKERIADSLHHLGRTKEAINMYKQVAASYMSKGSMIKAIALHKTILQLDPSNEEIKKELLSIFGENLPDELAHVVRDKTKKKHEPPKKPSAKDENLLGMVQTTKPPEQLNTDLDQLNMVFKDILGEEASLQSFGIKTKDPGNQTDTVARTPLFSELTKAELSYLIDQLKLTEYQPNQFLCKEGDPGHIMWVIVQGEVDIETRNKENNKIHLATLSEGDFFGEGGFVTGATRSASVCAKGDLTVLEITKPDFDACVAVHPRMKDVLHTFYQNRMADRVMAKNILFGRLPSFRRAELLQSFNLQTFQKGKKIFSAGGTNNTFYLIKSGEVELFIPETKKVFAHLNPGEFFGEDLILSNDPPTYSARAAVQTELLTLQKIEVEGIIQMFPESEKIFKKISKAREKSRTQ